MRHLYWLLGGFFIGAILSKLSLVAFLIKMSWLIILWLVVATVAVAMLGLPLWVFIWVVRKLCEKP